MGTGTPCPHGTSRGCLVSDLWEHQKEGVAFAMRSIEAVGGAALFWEMGTGKTRGALEVMLRLGADRVLVVCPKIVVPVWDREAVKYLGAGAPPVLALDMDGTKVKAAALAGFDAGIVVVNYDSVWREPLASALRAWAPGLMVLDELHRIKSPTGRASKWLGALAAAVPARLGLTGTPLAHGPLDVWAEYRAVAPSIFAPTFGAFRSRYTRPALRSEWRDTDVMVTAGRGGELSRWKMDDVAHLEAEVYRCAHRVRVVDVLDLPESSDVVVEASLEKEASRIYDEIQADFIADVSSSSSSSPSPVVVTAANAMVVALRLAQVTGGTLRDDAGGSHVVSVAKRDALTEYLGGMAGEPVVIFGRFRADLDAIHQAAAAAGLSSSELSGRRSELAAWQRGDTCVLVAQVAAGSVGIDLTRARVAVWYSLSYNLAEYVQSRARVLRPGQTRAVVFAHVIAKGTIDEGVYRALEARGDVVAAIVDGVVATSRRLPTVRA